MTCRACHRAQMLDAARRYIEVSTRGTCPNGHGLAFNNSLASSMWLQCLTPDCHYQILCNRDDYQVVIARRAILEAGI